MPVALTHRLLDRRGRPTGEVWSWVVGAAITACSIGFAGTFESHARAGPVVEPHGHAAALVAPDGRVSPEWAMPPAVLRKAAPLPRLRDADRRQPARSPVRQRLLTARASGPPPAASRPSTVEAPGRAAAPANPTGPEQPTPTVVTPARPPPTRAPAPAAPVQPEPTFESAGGFDSSG